MHMIKLINTESGLLVYCIAIPAYMPTFVYTVS